MTNKHSTRHCVRLCVRMCVCIMYKLILCFGRYLAVEKVSLDVGSDLLLPPISIAQQFLFVIQQLLVGLCRELKVGALGKYQ